MSGERCQRTILVPLVGTDEALHFMSIEPNAPLLIAELFLRTRLDPQIRLLHLRATLQLF